MKKKSKIVERLENITPEEMALRWSQMRPRYMRFLSVFILAALFLFLSNHFQRYSQGVVNVVNVAFQISCVFCVLFGMLTAMSFIYGRTPRKETT